MFEMLCWCMCTSVGLSGLYPLYVLSRQRSQTELIGRMCVSRRLEVVVVEADSSCCHFMSGSGMFTPLMGVESSDTHTHTHTHRYTHHSVVYVLYVLSHTVMQR